MLRLKGKEMREKLQFILRQTEYQEEAKHKKQHVRVS